MIDNLLPGNQARAFVLPVGAFVSRAPEKILVVEIDIHVIPASETAMRVDNAIWGVKLAIGQGKPADQNNRDIACPGQPGQAAAKTDEKVGMFQKGDAFLQG